MSIEEIREKYGDEVADKLKWLTDFSLRENDSFKIDIQEGKHVTTIYFITNYMVNTFKVYGKHLGETSSVSKMEAINALEMMRSILG
jgi:hypothetical protein